jgi:hypothetical protein
MIFNVIGINCYCRNFATVIKHGLSTGLEGAIKKQLGIIELMLAALR